MTPKMLNWMVIWMTFETIRTVIYLFEYPDDEEITMDLVVDVGIIIAFAYLFAQYVFEYLR